jgi:phosphate-selective porin OprO/OprP
MPLSPIIRTFSLAAMLVASGRGEAASETPMQNDRGAMPLPAIAPGAATAPSSDFPVSLENAVIRPEWEYDASDGASDLRFAAGDGSTGISPSLEAGALSEPLAALQDRVAELEKRDENRQAAEAEKKASDASKPTVHWSAELQFDSYSFNQDAANRAEFGDIQNGGAFRRARIAMLGDYGPTDYRLEMDYAQSGRPTFLDVYGGLHDLPALGHVRVGHFFEPFGLDRQTSNRYSTFMERSAVDQAFFPARNSGVAATNTWAEESGTWAVGYFRADSDNFGDDVGDNFENAITGRITALPYYASDGAHYMHLGTAYSYRGANDGAVRFQAQPEARVGAASPNVPFFVDTGNIAADVFQQAGLEFAVVQGPFSLQSEWALARINANEGTSPLMQGWYGQASYFLTGEHRPYRKEQGAFDRVMPLSQFVRYAGESSARSVCFGTGAWEIAMRLTYLDFNDANVSGGRLTDLTAGLNWYLTPYLRYTANYVHAFVNDAAGVKSDADIFGMRMGYDF